ncbi:MAG: hypothetical protein ABNG98_05750 [Flavobacterium sp.]|jgi:hypothetical protein
MKKIVLIINLFIVSTLIAQSNRQAFTLNIAANETQQYKADIQESPYFVKEKILQIYCGEKVFIECQISGDTISTMKIVEENINIKSTIEIELTQNSEDRKNISTMLVVKNPFQKKLNYNAIMYTPLSQTWKTTSIIPIQPNLMNFETWPHAIISIVLEGWRFEE